jgi:dTDP-4-amino-4,6-dideoxygalactose transaminase
MGIEPIFYPITTDTQVDIAALEKRVKANTRALIAVHFFGFIQDFKPLRTFCDERGLLLIEDCAHAFFGNRHGQSVGQYGDYAIASIMKFLPIDEGGCLVSRSHSLADLNMRRGGWFFQFKSALNILEMACEYHRLPWLKPLLRSKEWLWQKVKPQQGIAQIASQDSAEGADSAEFLFDPDKLGVNMSIPAVAIMKAFSFSKACSKRRDNYTQLLKALGDISGGHPLFAELPDGIYPQVFPMVMDDPDSVFPILKKAGVPIIRFGEFRWQGVDASTCPVSEELSRRVFQFPCHQSLTSQELDWMIATILSVLATAREHPSHRVA